jgi:hypothetical protein
MIPEYGPIAAPLYELVNKAMQGSQKRTNADIRNSRIDWPPVAIESFGRLKELLAKRISLRHPLNGAELFLWSDASDQGYASMLTQVLGYRTQVPVVEQEHQILGFASGMFKNNEIGWDVASKEFYACLHGLIKMEHIMGTKIHLVMDHKNFADMLDPTSTPGLSGVKGRRILRWRSLLDEFNYDVLIVEGKKNLYCDLLSRLTQDEPKAVELKAMELVQSSQDEKFEWPNLEEIVQAQKVSNNIPIELKLEGGIWKKGNKIWIPEDKGLRARVLVAAHAFGGGHRGAPATLAALNEHVWWEALEEDAKHFVQGCLHCVVSKTGIKVRRPLGEISWLPEMERWLMLISYQCPLKESGSTCW